MTATTVKMEYQSSEVREFSGVKGWYRPYIHGRRVVAGGCGTYITATPSHLILQVSIEGKNFDIWTERDFREALGVSRLTENLRDRIEATMPKEVCVKKRIGRKGTEYYVLADKSIREWVDRIS
jgi:hypothetical protein